MSHFLEVSASGLATLGRQSCFTSMKMQLETKTQDGALERKPGERSSASSTTITREGGQRV